VPSEKRTRVEIFLPLGSNPVVNEPVTEWLAEELAFARGGSTITTPFTGLYASATERDLVRDSVRVLFCDFDLNPSDVTQCAKLETYLSELRAMLLRVFRQEEIWITYHPINRVW
jgi:hypothetical protein